MKDAGTRQKIVFAAINCIEKHGIEGCTIRNIAQEAGMTFSSIHYYFESKEELVEEAMAQAVGGSFEDVFEIWQNRSDDLSAVKEILQFLFDGALRYPGVTRAGLYALFMSGKTDGLAPVRINELLQTIMGEVSPKLGISEKTLSMRLIQAFSSVLLLGISPQAFAMCSGADFQHEKWRAEWVRFIAEDLFKPEGKGPETP